VHIPEIFLAHLVIRMLTKNPLFGVIPLHGDGPANHTLQ
jgi:hypothetical protein